MNRNLHIQVDDSECSGTSDSDSIIDEEAQSHKSNDITKVSQSDDELASETSENEAEAEMVSENVHVHTTNSYATAAMTRLCCLRSCLPRNLWQTGCFLIRFLRSIKQGVFLNLIFLKL